MEWEKFKKQKINEFEKAIKENKVDSNVIPLIRLINKNKNWTTASSCHGQIGLLEYGFESEKKEPKIHGRWHSAIEPETVEMSILRHGLKKQLWFRFEPFVLEVAAKDIKSALEFLGKARKCGIRNCSIQSISKKVMMEMHGQGQIAIPVNQVEGKWTEIVEIANEMMSANAKTLEKIAKALKS
ncbi:MAG: hypothetical protein ABII22_03975 [Candidatus Micrarchaeota archaeon]